MTPERFTCPDCGAVSYHREDVAEGWCNICKAGNSERRQRAAMTPDERALLAEILRCYRCGLALAEHEVYFAPPTDPPLEEAAFPFDTSGLYCPT